MKRIGIIGHFGGGKQFLDGQTIKTKNLKFMVEEYGEYSTYCVDTYLTNVSKLKLLVKTVICLFKCRAIVILLGENGMRFYLPFLYWMNKLFKRIICHYVIGSSLIEMVKNDNTLIKYLNALTVNWFEYEGGSKMLREMGVKNVQTLPNCKNLKAVDYDSIGSYEHQNGVYCFCTFSRVMEEKGITEAIHAISDINKKNKKKTVHIDIYGQVDESYREKFDMLLREHSNCATYKGVVDSQASVDVLRPYYALLFPTHWSGEGFPGTVLDCYASAIPIIATDWNANAEIIRHGETGIIYPRKEICDLRQAIEWSIENEREFQKMKLPCREEYEKYTPENIGKTICIAFESAKKNRSK